VPLLSVQTEIFVVMGDEFVHRKQYYFTNFSQGYRLTFKRTVRHWRYGFRPRGSGGEIVKWPRQLAESSKYIVLPDPWKVHSNPEYSLREIVFLLFEEKTVELVKKMITNDVTLTIVTRAIECRSGYGFPSSSHLRPCLVQPFPLASKDWDTTGMACSSGSSRSHPKIQGIFHESTSPSSEVRLSRASQGITDSKFGVRSPIFARRKHPSPSSHSMAFFGFRAQATSITKTAL
jgi:hypothetical protein